MAFHTCRSTCVYLQFNLCCARPNGHTVEHITTILCDDCYILCYARASWATIVTSRLIVIIFCAKSIWVLVYPLRPMVLPVWVLLVYPVCPTLLSFWVLLYLVWQIMLPVCFMFYHLWWLLLPVEILLHFCCRLLLSCGVLLHLDCKLLESSCVLLHTKRRMFLPVWVLSEVNVLIDRKLMFWKPKRTLSNPPYAYSVNLFDC